jgi:hypothetical protein
MSAERVMSVGEQVLGLVGKLCDLLMVAAGDAISHGTGLREEVRVAIAGPPGEVVKALPGPARGNGRGRGPGKGVGKRGGGRPRGKGGGKGKTRGRKEGQERDNTFRRFSLGKGKELVRAKVCDRCHETRGVPAFPSGGDVCRRCLNSAEG